MVLHIVAEMVHWLSKLCHCIMPPFLLLSFKKYKHDGCSIQHTQLLLTACPCRCIKPIFLLLSNTFMAVPYNTQLLPRTTHSCCSIQHAAAAHRLPIMWL
jgi:hypothetical protein